jgi:hypothetical protein
MTGYGLECPGFIPGWGKKYFSFPQLPDWLSGPPSLLSKRYQRLFSQE